ncbi:MAG TPA: C45 family autoproteolytic acyltransferase/hydrolase [Thermoguttaceae bacterium]|nr:C45 family autoproteolytic acyltransferase/hydrolase [Thermoguttaceae bacterium]
MSTRRQFLRTTASSVIGLQALDAALAALAADAPPCDDAMVSLTGDPQTVGKRFGTLNAESVRRGTHDAIAGWRQRGLSRDQMQERIEPFRRFVAKFAPAWMDEMAGCAEAAGVPVDDYVVYEGGSPREIILFHECTSFAAVGSATADGAPLFQRIRDNRGTNCAFQKKVLHRSSPAGFYAFGNTPLAIAVSAMVNEHGLAGSADMGGLAEDRPTGRGVMNSHVIRLIAERAERTEDALDILQQMIRDRWYAGGKVGTHWLFVDRFGQGLRVAQNSHEEQHHFFEDDVAFLRRGDTAAGRLVTENKGRLTFRDMIVAGRHRDICGTTSIAGLSVRVDPERPAELSSVWMAQPAWAPYVPLFPIARAVPKEMVDGTSFLRGHDLLKLRSGSDANTGDFFGGPIGEKRRAFQEQLFADAADVEKRIRDAVARGQTEEAIRLAGHGARTSCARVMQFLAEAV